MWVPRDLPAVRLTSAKAKTLQQTQQPVLMYVPNLDRVLLANSDTWFHWNHKSRYLLQITRATFLIPLIFEDFLPARYILKYCTAVPT